MSPESTGHEPASEALLLRVLQFSAEKHRMQRRKGVDAPPYINHLIDGKNTSEESITQHRRAKLLDEEKRSQVKAEYERLLIWIDSAKTKQQQGRELLEKQTHYTEQKETYRTLAQNLQSDEFQAYILENFEEDLALHANVLLQELTHRYSLTIENGKYLVRDGWNGDDLRSVKTLSGGETFLSSLSMGLALSEKMSGGTEVGSLFLDEGFGTLDAEALEGVTDALIALQRQNRMVGIITHIQELAERLPAQIRITKSLDGSHLKML